MKEEWFGQKENGRNICRKKKIEFLWTWSDDVIMWSHDPPHIRHKSTFKGQSGLIDKKNSVFELFRITFSGSLLINRNILPKFQDYKSWDLKNGIFFIYNDFVVTLEDLTSVEQMKQQQQQQLFPKQQQQHRGDEGVNRFFPMCVYIVDSVKLRFVLKYEKIHF
ncbi:hypothetical protein TNCV_1749161 [Trichonephila clavipes]|nr:hypothetical protein TNCV_1749161 [Trichonephila clavipes]